MQRQAALNNSVSSIHSIIAILTVSKKFRTLSFIKVSKIVLATAFINR
jgi:hypothetical protein